MPSTVHVSNIYLSSHLSLNSLDDELPTGQLPKVLRDLPWQNACYPPVSYTASKVEPAVLLIKKEIKERGMSMEHYVKHFLFNNDDSNSFLILIGD